MAGETVAPDSKWPVDLLYMHLHGEIESVRSELASIAELDKTRHDALRDMLDERYQTQTKAVDAAFLAQQQATRNAFESAERAVQSALLAAEKAVSKAENAAERRFESVNEFRAQLTDQTATFIPRKEADTRFEALQEKITDAVSRLDVSAGEGSGTKQSWNVLLGAVALGSTVITTILLLTGR